MELFLWRRKSKGDLLSLFVWIFGYFFFNGILHFVEYRILIYHWLSFFTQVKICTFITHVREEKIECTGMRRLSFYLYKSLFLIPFKTTILKKQRGPFNVSSNISSNWERKKCERLPVWDISLHYLKIDSEQIWWSLRIYKRQLTFSWYIMPTYLI